MAKHPLTDHIIPPERELSAAKEALIAELRGCERIVRMGEQYLASCWSGHLLVTSDDGIMMTWTEEHWENCVGKPEEPSEAEG